MELVEKNRSLIKFIFDAFLCFPYAASYGLSFQSNGYMNDESVKVWAKSKTVLPELTTFSICTWVKFTYEVEIKL